MYCLLSQEERRNKLHSRRIDKILNDARRQEMKRIKLLLLGTGESGKSTFIKQMRIIYDKGFSEYERREFGTSILRNIIHSMKTMVEAMDCLNIEYRNESNLRNAQLIKRADSITFHQNVETYLSALKELWHDDGVQECYLRRREYQLPDSTKYFLDDIDRIAHPLYEPTEADILRVRIITHGLVEYTFNIKNVEFLMIDVGGQRSERSKWMHCFNQVKAVIFLAAISEYDQVLMESDTTNRLEESRNIFKRVSYMHWFESASIILFFNKIDLLKEKIMYSDLENYFPDYKGPKQDELAAMKFIEDWFMDIAPPRKIYTHFTCATDTENIKKVFNDVKLSVLKENLDTIEIF